jgi:hypothetical protein
MICYLIRRLSFDSYRSIFDVLRYLRGDKLSTHSSVDDPDAVLRDAVHNTEPTPLVTRIHTSGEYCEEDEKTDELQRQLNLVEDRNARLRESNEMQSGVQPESRPQSDESSADETTILLGDNNNPSRRSQPASSARARRVAEGASEARITAEQQAQHREQERELRRKLLGQKRKMVQMQLELQKRQRRNPHTASNTDSAENVTDGSSGSSCTVQVRTALWPSAQLLASAPTSFREQGVFSEHPQVLLENLPPAQTDVPKVASFSCFLIDGSNTYQLFGIWAYFMVFFRVRGLLRPVDPNIYRVRYRDQAGSNEDVNDETIGANEGSHNGEPQASVGDQNQMSASESQMSQIITRMPSEQCGRKACLGRCLRACFCCYLRPCLWPDRKPEAMVTDVIVRDVRDVTAQEDQLIDRGAEEDLEEGWRAIQIENPRLRESERRRGRSDRVLGSWLSLCCPPGGSSLEDRNMRMDAEDMFRNIAQNVRNMNLSSMSIVGNNSKKSLSTPGNLSSQPAARSLSNDLGNQYAPLEVNNVNNGVNDVINTQRVRRGPRVEVEEEKMPEKVRRGSEESAFEVNDHSLTENDHSYHIPHHRNLENIVENDIQFDTSGRYVQPPRGSASQLGSSQLESQFFRGYKDSNRDNNINPQPPSGSQFSEAGLFPTSLMPETRAPRVESPEMIRPLAERRKEKKREKEGEKEGEKENPREKEGDRERDGQNILKVQEKEKND